jgi:hypothetical protein
MTKTIEEAKADLLEVLPYIRYAVAEATKKGTARVGVLCNFADGGGKIEAQFDANFLEDVAILIGAPDQTPEDNLKAAARHVLDRGGNA